MANDTKTKNKTKSPKTPKPQNPKTPQLVFENMCVESIVELAQFLVEVGPCRQQKVYQLRVLTKNNINDLFYRALRLLNRKKTTWS